MITRATVALEEGLVRYGAGGGKGGDAADTDDPRHEAAAGGGAEGAGIDAAVVANDWDLLETKKSI